MADNLVKYYRNTSQFYIDLIDGKGNPVSGVNITMNINGVFYNRTTNENGTARLNINLPPGEYILRAIDPLTGLQPQNRFKWNSYAKHYLNVRQIHNHIRI